VQLDAKLRPTPPQILHTIFGLPTRRGADGRRFATAVPPAGQFRLMEQQFPYELPSGTRQMVFWSAKSSGQMESDVISARISEELDRLHGGGVVGAGGDFIWYANPKMSVIDERLYHVQVFWRPPNSAPDAPDAQSAGSSAPATAAPAAPQQAYRSRQPAPTAGSSARAATAPAASSSAPAASEPGSAPAVAAPAAPVAPAVGSFAPAAAAGGRRPPEGAAARQSFRFRSWPHRRSASPNSPSPPGAGGSSPRPWPHWRSSPSPPGIGPPSPGAPSMPCVLDEVSLGFGRDAPLDSSPGVLTLTQQAAAELVRRRVECEHNNSAASSPPGGSYTYGAEFQVALQTLHDMGFEHKSARAALERSGCNLMAAVHFLAEGS